MALGGPAWSLQWMPRDAASPRPLPGPEAPSILTVCKVAALLGWLHSSPARRSSSSAASSGLSLPPLAPCATFRPSCSWAPAPASVWSGVIPWKQAPRAASLQPRPHHPHWHSRAYSTSIIPLRPLRRRFGAVDLGHCPRYSFVLFLGWPPPSSPLYGGSSSSKWHLPLSARRALSSALRACPSFSGGVRRSPSPGLPSF